MLYTNLARKKHKVSIATETFHKALERDLAEKKKKKKKTHRIRLGAPRV
jgi:hypothetical protein